MLASTLPGKIAQIPAVGVPVLDVGRQPTTLVKAWGDFMDDLRNVSNLPAMPGYTHDQLASTINTAAKDMNLVNMFNLPIGNIYSNSKSQQVRQAIANHMEVLRKLAAAAPVVVTPTQQMSALNSQATSSGMVADPRGVGALPVAGGLNQLTGQLGGLQGQLGGLTGQLGGVQGQLGSLQGQLPAGLSAAQLAQLTQGAQLGQLPAGLSADQLAQLSQGTNLGQLNGLTPEQITQLSQGTNLGQLNGLTPEQLTQLGSLGNQVGQLSNQLPLGNQVGQLSNQQPLDGQTLRQQHSDFSDEGMSAKQMAQFAQMGALGGLGGGSGGLGNAAGIAQMLPALMNVENIETINKLVNDMNIAEGENGEAPSLADRVRRVVNSAEFGKLLESFARNLPQQ